MCVCACAGCASICSIGMPQQREKPLSLAFDMRSRVFHCNHVYMCYSDVESFVRFLQKNIHRYITLSVLKIVKSLGRSESPFCLHSFRPQSLRAQSNNERFGQLREEAKPAILPLNCSKRYFAHCTPNHSSHWQRLSDDTLRSKETATTNSIGAVEALFEPCVSIATITIVPLTMPT